MRLRTFLRKLIWAFRASILSLILVYDGSILSTPTSLCHKSCVRIKQDSGEKEHMLVGKRVWYRFNKECDGKTETAWYSGKIISQVLKICL
jgi:hypothetical protein